MSKKFYVFLFYVIWFTWFELCQGYGIQVLPEKFKLIYWINMYILFLVSISFALNIRAGIVFALPVMILEDIVITTIHRSFEKGIWYSLIHWNLENHPWYGAGTAWWLNTVLGLRLSHLEGFMLINVLATTFFIICYGKEICRVVGNVARLLRKLVKQVAENT